MRPHDVLGVDPGASPQEVRAAFRRFAATHHPDCGGDPERFRAGLEAYRRLAGGAGGASPQGRTGTANVVFHRRRRGLRVLTGRRTARRHLR